MDNFQYLKISKSVEPAIADLLQRNTVGTPGKSMIYGHTDMSEKLSGLRDFRFANLHLGKKLLGTICFLQRQVVSGQREHMAVYVRYFTFHEQFRSSGDAERKGTRSSIRQEVARVMNGEGLDTDEKAVFYAYVDADNVRSGRLIDEFGFRKAGTFHTIPYSRFFPKEHREVQRLGKEHQEEISQILMEFYRHFNLVTFEDLFVRGNYYAIKKDGQFVCGVQAIPDSWRIISLPGITGKVMMKIVPKVPLLRRLFNPDYRFLLFQNIFCFPGHEHLLEKLFDTALADMKRYSAILCEDPMSELYAMISGVNKGLTYRINGEKEIDIMVKTQHAGFLNPDKPFFVSGADVL
ncbi:MAG: hypothetical protein U5K79_16755 [Cyclobacteriaceae bacterium]|nr:hypothetical protein [Cyclobacteriaceae bacterium]